MSPAAKRKKKTGTKRVARKRSARKAARKTVRRGTRKAARGRKVTRKIAGQQPRKVARKRSPKAGRKRPRKVARRVAPRKARAGRPATKPRLRVVKARTARRTARPRAAPPPAFAQRQGASPKQLVLFEMIRARATLLAVVHGLPPASAELPIGDGKWSVRETVLHLITRDQARLRESEAALRGQPASWKDIHDPEMGHINEELMAPLRHLGWDEAVRLLHRTRELLMEELESVPEDPAEVWGPEHAFGWMFHVLPPHDRHHADIIKSWRAQRGF